MLKPFYIRHVTQKDLEMCVCKHHLHARWAVDALVTNARQQGISLFEINDYTSFHQYLTSDCPNGELTYIGWDCTPSRNKICDHVIKKWSDLKNSVSNNDKDVTVKMQKF